MITELNSLFGSDVSKWARLVYIYLDGRKNKDKKCWPAMNTIAKDLNVSRATVHKAVSELREKGFIETEKRYRADGGCSSLLYTMKL